MNKYLVIGNPIDHSLSPKLHNYWINQNKIDAEYKKLMVNSENLKDIIDRLKKGEITGVNVTVPYKNEIIKHLDNLTKESQETFSVNTIFKKEDKIVGHNTDIAGFELAIRHSKQNLKNKKVLLLGAGGVSPSIVFALKKFEVNEIIICNRTLSKAKELKKKFNYIKIIEWGEQCDFDVAINATSLGLKENDFININYNNEGKEKFFYDVIYNPKETNFLKQAKKNFHRTENGIMMFIYQAHQAFTIWHNLMPEIDENVISIIND